ncbi:ethanolamine ammonia-lyase subunit EutC [Virgibacillus sp. YIM 98842]|jgi:ethanolamine ammonia-lyase small subunit|uniref:ethanolamine ammonia-lyase subunit EutC n=1 Tax=Virgibacillus sp. YIM 98842 TaxID=2663533 RepID=UPI0013DB7881|nr:ethanolamine ammonia-lyase subunit EutC [Virgibacillus sp. YIM 98842]
MVNEKELKSLIENILHEMVEGTSSKTQKNVLKGNERGQAAGGESKITIPDISEVEIRKDLLVPDPYDKEGYMEMKEKTPARIGVWHAGPRYMTSTSLRFKADHAAAQDAVFSYVDEDFVEKNNLYPTATVCKDKDEYITRPDLGRQFSDEEKEKIKQHCGNPKVQIMVGDGLSSASIEANLEDTLPAIKQGLKVHGIDTENDLFVKHCRVPAMDVIGEVTDADVVCLLVGERPGLVTAESMSAYIAYKPTVDMPEARRTVVSNIHQGGTPPAEAGAHIAELIKRMIDKKASGLDLNKA